MYTALDFRVARVRGGFKAIDVAKLLGISPSKFSMIERGHIGCPKTIYEKLIELFKMYM